MSCSIAYSYYAVLLYMKFVLNTTSKSPIIYTDQDWPDENHHKRVLQEIVNRISDDKKGRGFKDRVNALHLKRVEADYEDNLYTAEEAIDFRNEAISLIAVLKNLFGNLEP